MSAQLREASSVILLRRSKPSGFEVFLLRRRKGASFMANAYVFPGGAADPGEDARSTAARELFEESGVLLAKFQPKTDDSGSDEASTLEMPSLTGLRTSLDDALGRSVAVEVAVTPVVTQRLPAAG